MVLFTLTGLNVDVGLYEFIEYPTYDFPDVSASYYLDLSMNPIYFDNVFYFKTTAPDLLDFNNNVRVIFNSNGTPIYSNSDAKGEIGDIWISEYPITYATDRFSEMGGNDSFFGADLEKQKKPEDFKLRAEQLHGRLLTTSEMINYLNSTLDGATQLKSRTGITSVNNNTANRYICTFNPPQDSYSEGVFEFVRVSDLNVFTATTNPNLFNGTNSDNRAALVYYTDYYDYDPDGPTILKDMAFKCESSNWPDISFSEGVISNDVRSDITNYLPPPSANGIHYNKNIGVQWLARNITGGYNNSDLFANEEALVQQYVDLDSSSSGISTPGIKELITNTLDVSGGSDATPLSNADIGRNNVSREALLHLLDNDISANVQRVHNMIAKAQTNVDSDGNDISFGDTSNLWIPIEFYDSDTIKFKLIYKPDQITNSSGAAIDDSGNALGTNIIEDQDYVVRLNIVGNRSDLFVRSSFLSSSVVENNVTVNGDNHILLDNIIQPNSSYNRNSNSIPVNDSNVYNDPNFGSYVKVGRAYVGITNSGDTLYNYYTWDKNKFNNKTANYNWTYDSLYNNSVYLTWIFRLHSGGYNKSIASQDIVPMSYSPIGTQIVDLTNESISLFSKDSVTNVLNNPQQFAVFFSKQFADANRNCTFGFFNGKYHFSSGARGVASIPLSSSMTSASEEHWRVITLAVGPHSNNSGNESEVSIFENGILLGNTDRNLGTLSNNSGNEIAFGFDSQGDDFIMGSFQGANGTIHDHLPSMNSVDTGGIEREGTDDDRHFQNTLPYDLALWELHESTATGVNVSFKAQQIYSDYVNKYKYDFVNGVSIA